MKFFSVLAVALFVTCVQALTDEQKEKVKQHYKECVSETGVAEELVQKGRKGEFTDDPKLKQFVFCFFKKVGFQNEQGDLQLDVIRAKIPTDVNKNEAEDVIKACKDITGTDAADKAFNVYKCYWNSTPNHIALV